MRLPRHLGFFDYAIPETLRADIATGQIVEVPFKARTIKAVVWHLLDEESSYPLKPLTRIIIASDFWSTPQRELIDHAATQYVVSPATILTTLFPPLPIRALTAYTKDLPTLPPPTPRITPSTQTLCIPHDIATHDAYYREIIAHAHARGGQVAILCPTVQDTQRLAALLVDTAPLALLHGEQTPTAQFRAYCALASGEARTMIGTRHTVAARLPHLDTIIIDQSERHEHKHYDQNPRFDARTLAWHRTTSAHASYISVSTAPRLEDYYTSTTQHALTLTSLTPPPKEDTPAPITTIHLKDEFRGGNYSFIGDTLLTRIKDAVAHGETVFLFLNRKGVSTVICKECDEAFTCDTCHTPERYFARTRSLVCPACHASRPLPDRCTRCGGMAYKSQGFGIEKIAMYLRSILPDYPIEILERSTTPTKHTPAIHDWHGKIIVGTSYALTRHPEIFTTARVVGILAADPIYLPHQARAAEYQWQILASLLAHTTPDAHEVFLQAFDPHQDFITTLVRRDYPTFAAHQLKERRTFSLPPFTRRIALWHTAPLPPDILDQIASRKKELETLAVSIDKSTKTCIISATKGDGTTPPRIVIQLPQDYAPDAPLPEALTAWLRALPNDWLVDVDPLAI